MTANTSIPPRKTAHLSVAGRASEWELWLYVAGQTPRSLAALANLTRICKTHLAGRYHIEVVDLLVDPQLSRDHQILAIPTLVRKLPEPLLKIIGDLSDTEKTLAGLQLPPAGDQSGLQEA